MPDPRDKQVETETRFHESLEDVLAVIEKCAPYCRDIEELAGMIRAARSNDATLRLLLKEVTSS